MQEGAAKYETTIPTADGSGQIEQAFTFTGVSPGTYSLLITKPGHTDLMVQTLIIGDEDVDLNKDSRPDVQLMTLCYGDINGDGLINDADLSILWRFGNYNKRIADAENSFCDLNGDDLINDSDLTILWKAYNYNRGKIVID